MVYAKIAMLAALAMPALAAPKTDVYLRVDRCTNLDSDGEPYVRGGMDVSILPGSTKYLKTSIGKVTGVTTSEATFQPYNVLLWENVPDFNKQKIEIDVYGADRLRPDSDLGEVDLRLNKIELPKDGKTCAIDKRPDVVVDTDILSRNGRCDFVIAVCPLGVEPLPAKGWEVGRDQSYSFKN